MRLLPVSLLAGCPYLWGPPEFPDPPPTPPDSGETGETGETGDTAVEADADADADSDSDTDADADADSDADADTDPGTGPLVVIDALRLYDQVMQVCFTAVDPDGNAVSYLLSETGTASGLLSELLPCPGISGSLAVDVPVAVALQDLLLSATVDVTDNDGNVGVASASRTVPYTVVNNTTDVAGPELIASGGVATGGQLDCVRIHSLTTQQWAVSVEGTSNLYLSIDLGAQVELPAETTFSAGLNTVHELCVGRNSGSPGTNWEMVVHW